MKRIMIIGLSWAMVATGMAQEKAEWYAGTTKVMSDGSMLIPDRDGQVDFKVEDSTGISLGERAPQSSDTKSLEFSGEQLGVFRTVNPLVAPGEAFVVELMAKLGEPPGEMESTLLRYGTTWELRHTPKTGTLGFIIWHDVQVYSTVSVAVDLGEWMKVRAEYDGTNLKISAGGKKEEAPAKDIIRAEPSPASLVMGSSAPRPVDGAVQRPFVGSLSEIRVTIE